MAMAITGGLSITGGMNLFMPNYIPPPPPPLTRWWTWGQNSYGQLGTNDRPYRLSPTQIGTGTTWSLVSVGQYNTAAILN